MLGRLGAIHDVAEALAERSTAAANLCVTGAGRLAPEHNHANPYLWLHVLGGYRETGDCGEREIAGPAAIFFPAGSAHTMAVREHGLASVIVEFDADWLRRRLGTDVDLARPRIWVGGEIGRLASRLARLWLSPSPGPADRFESSMAFLGRAMRLPLSPAAPLWLDDVDALIEPAEGVERSTQALARTLGVNQPRLARTYRRWRGEGLGPALRRRRVAAAAILLESTGLPLADIAVASGFCDQSHMNRSFRLVLGRTPAAIRSAQLGFADRRQ